MAFTEFQVDDGLICGIDGNFFNYVEINSNKNFQCILEDLIFKNNIKNVIIKDHCNVQNFNSLKNVLFISIRYNEVFNYLELYKLKRIKDFSLDFSYNEGGCFFRQFVNIK